MEVLRVSSYADEDIESIFRYTIRKWGFDPADSYFAAAYHDLWKVGQLSQLSWLAAILPAVFIPQSEIANSDARQNTNYPLRQVILSLQIHHPVIFRAFAVNLPS
jgi:hypothetical protein